MSSSSIKVETSDKPQPPQVAVVRAGKDRMPWQRMALSLAGIIIILLKWRWSTFHLYSIPSPALAAFTAITTNSDYVIGAIVIFMVTGRLVYEWRNQTVSQVVTESRQLFERREEDVHEDIEHHDMPDEGELRERYGNR